MMNAITTLYGKHELDKELLRIWFYKLKRYDFGMVAKSFDTWTDSNKKMPVPADILELCKAQESRQIVPMLTRRFTPEEKERNRKRLKEMLSELNIKSIDNVLHNQSIIALLIYKGSNMNEQTIKETNKAGRKPFPAEMRGVTTSLRLRPDRLAKFKQLGGHVWLNAVLDTVSGRGNEVG